MNVLDWGKLREFVAERKPVEVSAGILSDWFWTGDTVYENGAYRKDHGAYTHSDWATPGFKAEMENGDTIEVVAYRKATEEDLAAIKRKGEEARENLRKCAEEIRQSS